MAPIKKLLTRRLSTVVGDCDAFDSTMPRPFTYNGETFMNSKSELAKVVISCLLLIPIIRLCASVLLVFLGWISLRLVMIGWTSIYDENGDVAPITGWRQTAITTICPLVSRSLLFCWGVYHVRIRGQHAPKTANVIVSNHITIMDGFLLMSQFYCIAVAKQSVEQIPLIGSLVQTLQFILFDRTNSEDRSDVLKEIRRRAEHGGYPPILIFPEGTTSNGTTLMRFKKGAFAAGCPVQPVLVRYPWKHFDPCWTNNSPPIWVSLLEILCQPFQEAEVIFLPVRPPSAGERAEPQLYADNIRLVMAQALNVSIVPFSMEDSLVDCWLQSSGYGRGVVDIGVSVFELKERFKVRVEQIRSLIEDFDSIDTDGDRLISRKEFDAFIASLDTDLDGAFVDLVFHSFDSNDSSFLDYREFIIGSLTLNDVADMSDAGLVRFVSILDRAFGAYRLSLRDGTATTIS